MVSLTSNPSHTFWCHAIWIEWKVATLWRGGQLARLISGLALSVPPLPLPPVLQCHGVIVPNRKPWCPSGLIVPFWCQSHFNILREVGLRWMKHCKLCGIGLDLWAKKTCSTFIQGANYVPRPVSHVWEFVRTRGGILRQGAITKATDIPPCDMSLPWWLALRGSIIVSRGGHNSVKRSNIIWITAIIWKGGDNDVAGGTVL